MRGMARTSIGERARERVLSDDELRAVWCAADTLSAAHARMLQVILLTATRLREASNMNRSEINGGGSQWTIPAVRHKSKRDFLCPLSQAAQDVLAKLPVIGRKGWIFTTDGSTPISGFSKGKRAFDEDVLAELRKADPKAKLERWTTPSATHSPVIDVARRLRCRP